MGRPRLHSQFTERALIVAAEHLLATEGVAGLSARRLAEAAGTTTRAIYSLFGGMEGLLRSLFREGFRALTVDLDGLLPTDDPMADLVAAGAVGFRGWALKRPDLFRLVFQDSLPEITSDDSDAGREAFGRLVARVGRCVDAGLLPAGHEAEVALSVHALCEGMASLELRGRFPMTADVAPEAAWRRALEALVGGYRLP